MKRHSGVLAIARRHLSAALAVVLPEERLLIRRTDLRKTRVRDEAEHLVRLALGLCRDYGITHVVHEPNRQLREALEQVGLQSVVLTLAETKRLLVPERVRLPHRELHQLVIEQRPKLRRFVRILKDGSVASSDSERRRTVVLLAAALGLAEERRTHLRN